jgi:hypothetical protein
VFWSRRAAAVARFAQGATVVVVLADLVEDLFLFLAVSGANDPFPTAGQAFALDAAATAATIKFVLLVPAVAVAVVGVAVTIFRLYRLHFGPPSSPAWPANDVRLPTAIESEPPDPTTPQNATGGATTSATGGTSDEPRWRRAYNVPGVTDDQLVGRGGKARDVVGFCLSGGGIRSASVAMGALQTLREQLLEARYLVSVSGGGYTAGALAQLLTDAGDANITGPGIAVHNAKKAYMEGSAELDHVRRHSSYLATTATQMLVALGVLARGLLATLVLVFAPAVAIGIAAASFYHVFPIATVPMLTSEPSPQAAGGTNTFLLQTGLDLPPSAVAAVAVVVCLALLSWFAQITLASRDSEWGKRNYLRASRMSVFMTWVAVITTVGAMGIPALWWACENLAALTHASLGVGVGGSVGTVLLTYLAGLASIGWRNRKTIKKVAGATAGKEGGAPARAAVPNGLLQLILVIVSVGILCVSWLLLMGVTTVGAASDLAIGNSATPRWLAIGSVLVVVALGGLFDESSLSLHPFYRRRLASAFATRAVTVPGQSGPTVVAVPYHPRERTTLSRYARPAKIVGNPPKLMKFPEFIFAAAAHLTGEGRTPPGLNAVSFTMSKDWVGGPDVGWVRTHRLEEVSSARLRRDVTVQGAVAISGSAFASAMGRFARWYQIILAVSGARLGAWLPNPWFLGEMRSAHDNNGNVLDWTLPRLPRIRRATYLFRELFNIHPQEERLLQVTDGGHYENLGLVELLRRRCTTIYCIDGGGDSPPTAAGLAEAIALAKAELGVRIDLSNPLAAEPGAGRALSPDTPLAGLNATLSKEPVIVGKIHYPEASGLPLDCRTGDLYVARALLWPEMSYSLLSYAAQHPVFPHDSTGDQWFDDGQFTAYTQLGRELGDVVKQLKDAAPLTPASFMFQNGSIRIMPSRV